MGKIDRKDIQSITPFSEFRRQNLGITKGTFREPNLVIEFKSGARTFVTDWVVEGLTPLNSIIEKGETV